MSVSENWSRLRARADAAAQRAGRRPEDVIILAVSKTFSASVVREAYDDGLRAFGENYMQEAIAKMDELPADIEWHMVGHLQTNKARQAAGRFALIHSLDSVHLAEALDKQAAKQAVRQKVLLQVNIADEDSKFGFEPVQVADAAGEVAELEHLELRGLMTIGPLANDSKDIRWVFRELRGLRDKVQTQFPGLSLAELSMGMTGDFETAIEEGATLIRVGRAIFGERHTG
ncbi:MAG TPA: YggS family pyridoxal phosphate-dependent enzyme [Chloroflexota bacterium]|nr:YggS family pyridoxal phosphate-dependent enzyme [Chloroflexota bacterium]